MPLKKRSILEALKWDHIDVGTVLFLMGEDGLEPEEWTAEEKCTVVSAVVDAIEVATEPQHIDITNALGAIREAEMLYRENSVMAPTPSPEVPTASHSTLASELSEWYLKAHKPSIDAVELQLLAYCFEHMHFGSGAEAQAVLDVLDEIMGSNLLGIGDQVEYENLARCQVAVAKQIGALSVVGRESDGNN